MTGVLPTRDREEKGLHAWEPHRPPAWFQSYGSEVGNEEECNSDLSGQLMTGGKIETRMPHENASVDVVSSPAIPTPQHPVVVVMV